MVTSPNKRKTYITPEGAKKLQDELDYLWNVERRKVTREVTEAAAQGDRSENAEYIYGKKRLREIDSRLRFLGKRLDEVIIVRPGEVGNQEKIYFGAWVTLEDEAGNEHRYRLVGPDETDAGHYLGGDAPRISPEPYSIEGMHRWNEHGLPANTSRFSSLPCCLPRLSGRRG